MKVKVTQSCPTLCILMDYSPWHSTGQNTGGLPFPFSRGSSQPIDQTQVLCITGGFFTSWATGKTKNIGVCCLSLLKQIFPSQESNRGLLNCRQILCQLSFEGSPLMQNARLDEAQLESRFPGEISIISDTQWHHPYGRKQRRTKEPFDESERVEWKSWLKAQHSEN